MKRFISQSVLLFSIVVTLYLLIALYAKSISTRQDKNDYMAAMIDKHRRMNVIRGPKIIFVGGSNLAFGLDSHQIEKELSVPVVNLGLHAGLGLDFMLKELKSSIKEGDVVFLSIEYFLDEGQYELMKYTTELYPRASEFYDIQLSKEISLHLQQTRKNLNNLISSPKAKSKRIIYSRNSFNEYGDLIIEESSKPTLKLRDRGLFQYRFWEGIEVLNEFYNYAKSKKAQAFFIYPVYPKSKYYQNLKVISQYDRDITSNLEMDVLNKPADTALEDSLFYDTVYHLNSTGRTLRTKQLLQLIKKNNNAQHAIQHAAIAFQKKTFSSIGTF